MLYLPYIVVLKINCVQILFHATKSVVIYAMATNQWCDRKPRTNEIVGVAIESPNYSNTIVSVAIEGPSIATKY